MKEIFPDKDTRSFDTTLREFTSRVKALGGDEDTVITIEADGEPVYVYCRPEQVTYDEYGDERNWDWRYGWRLRPGKRR